MKRFFACVIIFALLFSTLAVAENTNQNPLKAISEEYATGERSSDIEGPLNEAQIKAYAEEYMGRLQDFNKYYLGHMALLTMNDESFSDYEDFESTFQDLYIWANNIIYYSGEVETGYEEYWGEFQNVLRTFLSGIDSAYTQKGWDVNNTIMAMINTLSSGMSAANATLESDESDAAETAEEPAVTVAFGEQAEAAGVARVTVKEISYQNYIGNANELHYEPNNPDNVFLTCHFDLINMKTQEERYADNLITFEAVYEGGYTYTGWNAVVSEGNVTPYAPILPLTTYDAWCAIEVPSMLQGTTYELYLKMGDQKFLIEGAVDAQVAQEESIESVEFGKEIEVEGVAKITLNSISYENAVYPTDTTGYYYFYEIKEDGKVYLAINFNFTNSGTESTQLENCITFEATYDGGYNYTGMPLVEVDNTQLLSYTELKPLSNALCWYLIEVPDMLKDTSFDLMMDVGNHKYHVSLDGIDKIDENISTAATPEPEFTGPGKYSKDECWEIAKKYFLSRAWKNPSSVIINSYYGSMLTDGYLFSIDYSAQNGFGGYNRGTYTIEVNYNTGEIGLAFNS